MLFRARFFWVSLFVASFCLLSSGCGQIPQTNLQSDTGKTNTVGQDDFDMGEEDTVANPPAILSGSYLNCSPQESANRMSCAFTLRRDDPAIQEFSSMQGLMVQIAGFEFPLTAVTIEGEVIKFILEVSEESMKTLKAMDSDQNQIKVSAIDQGGQPRPVDIEPDTAKSSGNQQTEHTDGTSEQKSDSSGEKSHGKGKQDEKGKDATIDTIDSNDNPEDNDGKDYGEKTDKIKKGKDNKEKDKDNKDDY